MTTKLTNPHYLPEVCIRVTIINFTVTAQGKSSSWNQVENFNMKMYFIFFTTSVPKFSSKFQLQSNFSIWNTFQVERIFKLNSSWKCVGLEDQLLGEVVKKEKPDIEEKRLDMITRLAADKKTLKSIEEKILKVIYQVLQLEAQVEIQLEFNLKIGGRKHLERRNSDQRIERSKSNFDENSS